jgi:hypothetical protein
MRPYLKKTLNKKGVGGVAEDEGPEFKALSSSPSATKKKTAQNLSPGVAFHETIFKHCLNEFTVLCERKRLTWVCTTAFISWHEPHLYSAAMYSFS